MDPEGQYNGKSITITGKIVKTIIMIFLTIYKNNRKIYIYDGVNPSQ